MLDENKKLSQFTKASRPSDIGPWWALKNSAGKKDVAMTLMIVSFLFCLLLAILGSFEAVQVGEKSFNFRAFDMGFATTVFAPLVALFTLGVVIQRYRKDCMTIRSYG